MSFGEVAELPEQGGIGCERSLDAAVRIRGICAADEKDQLAAGLGKAL